MEKLIKLITSGNRSRTPITPQYLTIHNTANTAPAINERNNLQNNYNPQRKASFHWVVDDKQAIQCIPENEQAFHAGTSKGNMTSIGMEICEPKDGLGVKSPLWPQIYRNAVELAADILKRHGWPVECMVTHKSWSGKECPRLLLPIWNQFVSDVRKELSNVRPVDTLPKTNVIAGGKKITGYIDDGVTYVPLRETAEALGKKVTWDAATKTTTIS